MWGSLRQPSDLKQTPINHQPREIHEPLTFPCRTISKLMRGCGLGLRPLRCEPDELPNCSTPRREEYDSEGGRHTGQDYPSEAGCSRGEVRCNYVDANGATFHVRLEPDGATTVRLIA